jgi:hypothetical protein
LFVHIDHNGIISLSKVWTHVCCDYFRSKFIREYLLKAGASLDSDFTVVDEKQNKDAVVSLGLPRFPSAEGLFSKLFRGGIWVSFG